MINLQKLVIASLKLYRHYKPTQSLLKQVQQYKLEHLLNNINYSQLGLTKPIQATKKGIGFANIYIQDKCRISLYYIPKNQIMQIHDHPKMQVLSYIIKGQMQAKLYTQLQSGLYSKIIKNYKQKQLHLIDGISSNEYNLHEFKAIEPAYFIDIMFPDYDHQHQGKFYQQKQSISNDIVRLSEVSADKVTFFDF